MALYIDLAYFPFFRFMSENSLIVKISAKPLDILRFKLANFGAAKFDPKSALWTRITMFQGAPLPEELDGDLTDDWWLPTLP